MYLYWATKGWLFCSLSLTIGCSFAITSGYKDQWNHAYRSESSLINNARTAIALAELASAQSRLGDALRMRGDIEGYEAAATAYSVALGACADPHIRAQLQVQLGDTLVLLGNKTNLSERLEQAVIAYRMALSGHLQGQERPSAQVKLADTLAANWRKATGTERLNEAALLYRAALYDLPQGTERAQIQTRLGTVLYILAVAEDDYSLLPEAINVYSAAADVLKPGSIEQWRDIQLISGEIYYRLGFGDSGSDYQILAKQAFEAVISESMIHDRNWWEAKQNLVLTMIALDRSGKMRASSLKEAVTIPEALLDACQCDSPSQEWAYLSSLLAAALRNYGEFRHDLYSIERAIALYEKILQISALPPSLSVESQLELGMLYCLLGRRTASRAELLQAISKLNEVATAIQPEQEPHYWHILNAYLAYALWSLGQAEIGSEYVNSAISAHLIALSISGRKPDSLNWALDEVNLANALVTSGQRKGDFAVLNDALSRYDSALAFVSVEQFPIQWAAISNDKGNAIFAISETQENKADKDRLIERAIEIYEAALQVFSITDSSFLWAGAKNNLGRALLAAGRLDEALAAHEQALSVTSRKYSNDWAMIQSDRGLVLQAQGKMGASLVAQHEALKMLSKKQFPALWATVKKRIGDAEYAMTVKTHKLKYFCRTLTSYLDAWIIYPPDSWYRKKMQKNIAGVLGSISTEVYCDIQPRHRRLYKRFERAVGK